MVFLSMKCISAVTNYSDIRRQVVSLKNEKPFDRIVSCRFICFEMLNYLVKVTKGRHFSFLL